MRGGGGGARTLLEPRAASRVVTNKKYFLIVIGKAGGKTEVMVARDKEEARSPTWSLSWGTARRNPGESHKDAQSN
jgi:hypothetical protein